MTRIAVQAAAFALAALVTAATFAGMSGIAAQQLARAEAAVPVLVAGLGEPEVRLA